MNKLPKVKNKPQNASGNIEEMAMAVCKGQTLQAKTRHCTEYLDARSSDLFSVDGLEWFWRIKPDAYAEAWGDFIGEYVTYHGSRHAFKSGWDAAMEHKADD
jgi:hypothetical protein